MSMNYSREFQEATENVKIRDLLHELGFDNGKTILVIGDGSRLSIVRPSTDLLPKMIEAIQWVHMTRGNVTFQRGPAGGEK